MALPDHIKSAIRSGPVPELRDWRSLPTEELTRAERNMRFVERYCVVPEGSLVGQNIKLADFQQLFYYAVYDNEAVTTDAYLSIARKNSKTATIATIVLVHLVGPEAQLNSEIVSGAKSREQAGLVYRYASKMVGLSSELKEIIRPVPSKKKLIGLPRNVEYTAVAREASTAFGGSPIVAILDEVGQIEGPQDDFVDAITTSQGAHDNPLLIAISTQAPTDADMFSVWIDDASDSSSPTPSIVCHVYESDKDCDVLDEKQWQMSNPALGLFRSEPDLRRQAERANRMPSAQNTVRNLYLNQRVNTVSVYVSEAVWKGCAGQVSDMQGVTVYGGLDLSGKTDLTALLLIWKEGDIWQVSPHFWAPEDGVRDRAKRDRAPYDQWARDGYLNLTPGKTVDYEYIALQIPEILGDCGVNSIAFDRWRIDIFKKELDAHGIDLPLVPFGQGYKDMAPALDVLEAELLNGRIAHGGHPVLQFCAANAVATADPAGGRKLDKSKARGRIDGMQALAMAMGSVNMDIDSGPSVYEERGLLTV